MAAAGLEREYRGGPGSNPNKAALNKAALETSDLVVSTLHKQVSECVCMCVCVCVRERERERERLAHAWDATYLGIIT